MWGGIASDAFGYRVSFRIGAVLVLTGGLLVYFLAHEDPVASGPEIKITRPGFKSIFMLHGFFSAVLIMFSIRFSNTIVNPSFPLIVKDILPTTKNINSITGSVKASAALAGAISAALLGHIGDMIGRRKVLVLCCIGACIASKGHFFARNIGDLVMARILFGLTIAGMLPAANAMINSVIDRDSIGKAYGLATSLSMFGTALGPFVGGYLAETTGLRTPFLVAALGQICLAVMVIAFVSAETRPTSSGTS